MSQSFASVVGLGRRARRLISEIATEAVGHRVSGNYGLAEDSFRAVDKRWGDPGVFFLVACITALGLPEDIRTGRVPMAVKLTAKDMFTDDERDITIDETPPEARAFVRMLNCVATGDGATGRDVWNSMPEPDKRHLAAAVTEMAASALHQYQEGRL